MHDLSLLWDLLWIFGTAIVVVLGVAKLRLPSVAGFILAGVLIGPHAIGVVRDVHAVQTLAEVGVILLLFGVGLEMPLGRLRQLLRPMLLGGTLQVALTCGLAFAVARAVGLGSIAALVVAMLVAPSSTALVLRGLDARGELEAPHGQLMLGILLFQDLCVVPMMLLLPALGGESTGLPWTQLGKSAFMLVIVVGSAALLVPRALRVVTAARQRDAFVLAVLVSCFGTAYAASFAGVSLALGAFLGGVVVAGSEYRHQAMAELAPMREVLASLFFVSVGMLLDVRLFVAAPIAVFATLCGLVLGKALVVIVVAAVLRLPARVAVVAGVGLAQMGEFALVLARSAESASLIAPGPLQILIAAATLSMIATPLLLALGPRLAQVVPRMALQGGFFGTRPVAGELSAGAAYDQHVIIAGFGLAGEALASALSATHVPVVVVDLNAASVRRVAGRNLPAYFGDISSREVLEHVGFARARLLVLLINDPAALERAVVTARGLAAEPRITARVRYQRDAASLLALGANEIVVAEIEAGNAVVRNVLAYVTVTSEPQTC